MGKRRQERLFCGEHVTLASLSDATATHLIVIRIEPTAHRVGIDLQGACNSRVTLTAPIKGTGLVHQGWGSPQMEVVGSGLPSGQRRGWAGSQLWGGWRLDRPGRREGCSSGGSQIRGNVSDSVDHDSFIRFKRTNGQLDSVRFIRYTRIMTDIPVTERLKALRNRAGITMAEAAETLELKTPSGYQHYEDPKKFVGKYLRREIVEKLIPLLVGRGTPAILKAEVLELGGPRGEPIITLDDQSSGRLIPIYAAAQGGEGHLIIDHSPIDQLPGPEELRHVRDPYGILIVGESMVPAYRPGDIAWVNPRKLPERDTDVVLYHVPPFGEAEAIIKTLVSWSPQEWKLRQYQPPRDFIESIIDWPICHRIVGKKNAR